MLRKTLPLLALALLCGCHQRTVIKLMYVHRPERWETGEYRACEYTSSNGVTVLVCHPLQPTDPSDDVSMDVTYDGSPLVDGAPFNCKRVPSGLDCVRPVSK